MAIEGQFASPLGPAPISIAQQLAGAPDERWDARSVPRAWREIVKA